MFTNSRSQRVTIVINFKYCVSEKLERVHQGCDYLVVANLICKQHANDMLKQLDVYKVINNLQCEIIAILLQYKLEKSEAKYSELQIHPKMKNALCYVHGVLISNLFANLGRNIPDTKIYQLIKLNSLGFLNFGNRYYSKLYSVDLNIYEGDLWPGDFIYETDIAILPANLPLTSTSLNQQSTYFANDSECFYLLVVPQPSPDLLVELFGNSELGEITQTSLSELLTSHNVRVGNIIQEIRRRNPTANFYLPLLVLTSAHRAIFKDRFAHLLNEDNRTRSYLSLLKQLHARIQSK